MAYNNSSSSFISFGIPQRNKYDAILLTIYFVILAISSTTLNGLVMYLTRKHHQLQEPRMYVRVAYAAFDMAFAIVNALHFVIEFNIPTIPVWLKCLSGDIVTGCFFATSQLTAFIALERYFYFCKPMAYSRIFTLRLIVMTSITIFVTTQAYFVVKGLFYDRNVQSVMAMCGFKYPFLHNLISLLILVLPAAAVTVFSIYNIIGLVKNMNANVSAFPNGSNTEPMLRKNAAKHGLR